ncbi:MAG: tpd [Bacillales bacterium]|jgi:uncharacterized protein involved in high-affinity Fe2+ transport|nr:tpd [Bacillales bacterium]
MKKLLSLIAAGLLVTSLVGCGDKEATEKKEDTKTEDKVAPGSADDAGFREYPIGDEVDVKDAGLKVAAVYLKPVVMEPAQKAGLTMDQSDIHLEADISALENNPLGFGVGEFVPYLTVKYKLVHEESGKIQEGSFMPMNAGDGSHYGANVKMMGAGTYKLTFTIDSPEKQDFLIHTDKDTGVHGTFWKQPVELTWDFPFVPRKW